MKFLLIALATTLALLLSPGIGTAADPILSGYPVPIDDYVNDQAGVMSPADIDRVRALFDSLEKQTGIEATVLTVNSIKDFAVPTNTSIESFATGLFNDWGVGHKGNNSGVLLLVAVADREARIELGSGYSPAYDSRAAQVVKRDIIPYFAEDDYSRGIYEGSQGIIDSLTREATFWEQWGLIIIITIGIIVLVIVGISLIKSGKKGWGWAAIIGAVGLLLLLLRILSKGKKTGGFGGGSSSGGGATGRW